MAGETACHVAGFKVRPARKTLDRRLPFGGQGFIVLIWPQIRVTSALFADDPTIVGRKGELDEGAREVKRVMEEWEERNN